MVYKPKYLREARNQRLSIEATSLMYIEAILLGYATNDPDKTPSYEEVYKDVKKVISKPFDMRGNLTKGVKK